MQRQDQPANDGQDNEIDLERRAAARQRTGERARKSIAGGEPMAWFEDLYAEAGGDASNVPWADLAPHPLLAELLNRAGATGPERESRALVVGCGLGDDLGPCGERGFRVEGFDLSPSAVEWAQKRFPDLADRFHVRDLFRLPGAWDASFQLIVEIYTLQALPLELRRDAFRAIARVLAPGGCLALICRALPAGIALDAERAGPPWPIAEDELRAWGAENNLNLKDLERVSRGENAAEKEASPGRYMALFVK
ncbi:MAG: SAM-dependent methyltransferase [Planctomycetota bacterium]|jgi:SAM-dependent methyltransferase